MQLVFTRSEIHRPEVFRRDFAIGCDREGDNNEWAFAVLFADGRDAALRRPDAPAGRF
jgi:hypothetical protein